MTKKRKIALLAAYTVIVFIAAFTLSIDRTPKTLETSLGDLIQKEIQSGDVNKVSLYYESQDGQTISIDADRKYTPASLMKVVVMMAYLKRAEEDPSLLGKDLVYTSDIASQIQSENAFDAPSELTVGQSYWVDYLITRMIIQSDNGATFTLVENIDIKYITDIYSALNLPLPVGGAAYTISPKDYSSFLRALFEETYLNPEMSKKAKALLSQTTYRDGLVAGVPGDIRVAQKFGHHVGFANGRITEMQLHNCGIVYAQTPYLLCIMTEGNVDSKLADVIKDLSKKVYSFQEKSIQ